MTSEKSATSTSVTGPFHFVLVHGFGSGAWCWYKVRTLLEASGYKVTCLDLKASGIDSSSPHSVRSFEAYTEPLTHFLSCYSPEDPHEKVILVGHSAGGLSVTDATYKFGDKIHIAVYVAASMLKHGFSTEQDLIDGMPEILRSGTNAKPNHATDLIVNGMEQAVKIGYHMSPPEDIVLANMLQRSGPLEAISDAKFSGTEAEHVPRVYIKTLHDQILKPGQQEAMISRWPPALVFSLSSDHNPLFSAPFLLSGLLAKAAEISTCNRN